MDRASVTAIGSHLDADVHARPARRVSMSSRPGRGRGTRLVIRLVPKGMGGHGSVPDSLHLLRACVPHPVQGGV